MQQADLYAAILARRSMRRYIPDRLDDATLEHIRVLAQQAQPLLAENRFEVLLRSPEARQDLVADLGGYGHIVNPPHYLVPYIIGGRHQFEDLGLRCEQLVVRLSMLGLGSCFIGCLGREGTVRARFGLPAEAQVAALIVCGRPATSLGGHLFNAAMRRTVGATNKLPPERIFYNSSFAMPTAPPAPIAPLIEAARHAPSADNAQPWRLLWRDGCLSLLIKRRNPRYGPGAGQGYNRHDGGLAMGNIVLALEALGQTGHWVPYEKEDAIPDCPASLLPLAWLNKFP